MEKNVKKPELLSGDKRRKNFAETDKKITAFCQKNDSGCFKRERKKRRKKWKILRKSADFATLRRLFGVLETAMFAKIRKTLIRH